MKKGTLGPLLPFALLCGCNSHQNTPKAAAPAPAAARTDTTASPADPTVILVNNGGTLQAQVSVNQSDTIKWKVKNTTQQFTVSLPPNFCKETNPISSVADGPGGRNQVATCTVIAPNSDNPAPYTINSGGTPGAQLFVQHCGGC